MKYRIEVDGIVTATIEPIKCEFYCKEVGECNARVVARLIASQNSDTTVVMWHINDRVEEKEYIQKKGDDIEFDEAHDEYDEDLNRWYAVQIGDDTDCGSGSEDYEAALDMARTWAKDCPGEEVRIVYCTQRSDFADDVEVIQEASHKFCCSSCGTTSEDDYDMRVVDVNTPEARMLCDYCVATMENSGELTRCECCGNLFSPKRLKINPANMEQEICPICGEIWCE